MISPKYLTLTAPRSPRLSLAIIDLRKAFNRWRRLKAIAPLVKGGIYKIEAKPKPDGWHVHIHAIIDGAYLPAPLLWATWAKTLGLPEASAKISRFKGDQHTRDLAKYHAKNADVSDWTDEQLLEFIDAWHGKRMFTTFGTWYNRDLSDLLENYRPEKPECPSCGSRENWIPIRAGPNVFGKDWDTWKSYAVPNLPETRRRPDLPWEEKPAEITEPAF